MGQPFHEVIAEYQGRIMNYSVAMTAMDGPEFTHKERAAMLSKRSAEVAELAALCISVAVYPLIVMNKDTKEAQELAQMIFDRGMLLAINKAEEHNKDNSEQGQS